MGHALCVCAGQLELVEAPGVIVESATHKMSKSRGNVVNPNAVVDEFGADSLRLYIMFMGPVDAVKPWDTSRVSGVHRCGQSLFAQPAICEIMFTLIL